MNRKPQLLIGAPCSGSGKTTFTMGLLRALQRQGLRVQPYKCGPDYIDSRFHALATGRETVNLDTWLASAQHNRELYARYGADADACVVEGVMGLYDGYDRMQGSSAEIALLLDIPVLLVVNARSTAYSVAAQLYGLSRFHPGLQFAGVVFTQVASENHFRFLRQASDDAGLRCFGWIPRDGRLEIPSRHLGLTLSAGQEMEQKIDRAADQILAHVDLPALLEAVQCPVPAPTPAPEYCRKAGTLRIAVARDAAFNFIYRENLARLSGLGDVRVFSPLAGDPLPECDLLYLPGGYPELFAAELASAVETREQIRDFAESGGRVLAECGGMIYLTHMIVGVEKGPFPMCGVLPCAATMEGARLHLGYRRIVDVAGRTWKGHEFHYSRLDRPDMLPSVARQFNACGEHVVTALYRYKNVFAGYTHLYWGENDIMQWWDE